MSEASTTDTGSTGATTTVDPIEVNGGDTAVTFDDLERIDQQTKEAKKAEKDSVKQTVKEAVKELDKKGQKDEKSAKKADDKEEGEEEDAGKKDAKAKLEKTGEKEKKTIRAKLGDGEIEIDPDAVLTVKVDGKDHPVSLRELQSHFSGKVSWDKKFSELAKEKQAFQQKFQTAAEKIEQIFGEQDPELRFFHMAELAGQDPVQVRRKFLDDNIKLLESWYSMSDDEKEADLLKYENRILKHQQESKQKEEQRRQTQAGLQKQIADLGKTHQISDEEFWSRYDELKALKQEGKLQENLSPQFVAETILRNRLWDAAADIIDNSQLSHEKRGEALFDLVELCFAQGLGPAQIREMADELWGQKARSTVVEQKVKEQEELRTGKKTVTKKPTYSGSSEVWSFDQI